MEKLSEMYDRARKRGIQGVYLIDDKDVYDIEPNINHNIKKGLYFELDFSI